MTITGPAARGAQKYHRRWKPPAGQRRKGDPRPNRAATLTMSAIFRGTARYLAYRGFTIDISSRRNPATGDQGRLTWRPQSTGRFRA